MTLNSRFKTLSLTVLLDYAVVLVAWELFLHFDTIQVVSRPLNVVSSIQAGYLHALYWVIVFAFSGLYKNLFLISRLDEFVKVVKSAFFGTLLLYFVIMSMDLLVFTDKLHSTLIYFGSVILCTGAMRFTLRTIQRALVMRGKGLHRSVIVGVGETAKTLYDDIQRTKTLGHHVLGFFKTGNESGEEADTQVDKDLIVGNLSEIYSYVQKEKVQDVIIALEPHNRNELVHVLSTLDTADITMKIVPDFYHVVNGLNKTNQIFGLPLIEINPDPMPIWEKVAKRAMDITISILLLILTAPISLIIAIIIKLDSEGPIVFSQKRVGKHGREFTMYKFRTMYQDAESRTGPTWAKKNDPRITPIGLWLRKLRLDEIPQFMNVLSGNMSLVGPRPERKYFVEQFIKTIPLYSRRLRVSPGITGWAQVKWKYDATLDDVKEKTKYDLFYVENMSLRMDLKILINTLLVIIKGKGQ